MAFLGQQYAPVAHAPQDEFAPIPSGEYLATITDSDMKPTKRGDGQYLELTYQIIDGPFNGRQLWARLNLDNPNQKAVEIAKRDLQKIQFACGGIAVSDSVQLHNIPHLIRVEFVPANPAKNQNRDGNEIKGWKRQEGVMPAANASPFAQRPAAPAPAAPAWAAKPAPAAATAPPMAEDTIPF